ncbi:MAG TPA: hypothetical protein VIS76_03015 [Pseudomonadales bacterium]
MQGRPLPDPGEPYRDAEEGERYDSAQDNVARFVVYFGPYLFWGSLGAVAGMIFLLTG